MEYTREGLDYARRDLVRAQDYLRYLEAADRHYDYVEVDRTMNRIRHLKEHIAKAEAAFGEAAS